MRWRVTCGGSLGVLSGGPTLRVRASGLGRVGSGLPSSWTEASGNPTEGFPQGLQSCPKLRQGLAYKAYKPLIEQGPHSFGEAAQTRAGVLPPATGRDSPEPLATSTPQLRQWAPTPRATWIAHHSVHYTTLVFFHLLLFSHSVVSDSATSWIIACQVPLYMGDYPSKNTGIGCHFLLQGIFATQGSNLCPVHWQEDSLCLSHLDKEAGGHSCHWQSLYNYLALTVVGQKDRMISLSCWLPRPKPILPLNSPDGWNHKALGSLSHLDVGFLCCAVRSILSYLKVMPLLVWPPHIHIHTPCAICTLRDMHTTARSAFKNPTVSLPPAKLI